MLYTRYINFKYIFSYYKYDYLFILFEKNCCLKLIDIFSIHIINYN